MRTIDADPISKHLSVVIKHNIDKDLSYTKERLFKLMIDNAPTIDAEPVKHGKWIDLKCDQCGQVDMSKPNYCPNCGAKMYEEVQDV